MIYKCSIKQVQCLCINRYVCQVQSAQDLPAQIAIDKCAHFPYNISINCGVKSKKLDLINMAVPYREGSL